MRSTDTDLKSIAIVGSGIAGLGAAWLLSRKHRVTLYEKDNHLGGHANTQEVPCGASTVPVDTGFMVFNNETYPNLIGLFDALGVPSTDTDMSFGVTIDNGSFEFSSDNVFIQRRNLLRPSYYRMLRDIIRFNREAERHVGRYQDEIPLRQMLQELGTGSDFRDRFLLPMAGAIWSTDPRKILDYPVKNFVTFFRNHGLLHPKTLNPLAQEGRIPWRTVVGGSRTYVSKLVSDMEARVLTGRAVCAVHRGESHVSVIDETGDEQSYDGIVFASHPGQTLRMLSDATSEERHLLESFPYSTNRTVLHRDPGHMLRHTKRWTSWTTRQVSDGGLEFSYYMNRLQHIDVACPVFVTLNPHEPIASDDTFYTTTYEHPVFSVATVGAQERIRAIQGKRRTWFAGAWLGHGFHEDGLRSAVEVARTLGIRAPWQLK